MDRPDSQADYVLRVEVEGKQHRDEYPVRPNLDIGRAESCTIRIDDPRVDPQHAKVTCRDDGRLVLTCTRDAQIVLTRTGEACGEVELSDQVQFRLGPATITILHRTRTRIPPREEPWLWGCCRCHARLTDQPHELSQCPSCGLPLRYHESGDGEVSFEGWLPRELEGQKYRYEVRTVAGAGGMGIVLRCQNLDEERPAAVKLLRSSSLEDRFEKEVETLDVLDAHRHVIRLQDWGVDRHLHWLAMDWVDGQPLPDKLASNTLTGKNRLDTVEDWLEQIVKGLGHLHKNGVIHRDLKPENILITEEGQVRIADMGIAKTLADAQQIAVTGVAGTDAYMSPEQKRGKPLTKATDIYSFGLLWSYLLTGRTGQPTDEDLRVLPNCPEAWRPCLRQCLAEDPERRPTLKKLLGVIRSRRAVPRWRSKKVLAGGTALLLIVAVIATWLWLGSDPEPLPPDKPMGPIDPWGLKLAQLGLGSPRVTCSFVEDDMWPNPNDLGSRPSIACVVRQDGPLLYLLTAKRNLLFEELREADDPPDILEYKLDVVFLSGTRVPAESVGVSRKYPDLALIAAKADGLKKGADYVVLAPYHGVPAEGQRCAFFYDVETRQDEIRAVKENGVLETKAGNERDEMTGGPLYAITDPTGKRGDLYRWVHIVGVSRRLADFWPDVNRGGSFVGAETVLSKGSADLVNAGNASSFKWFKADEAGIGQAYKYVFEREADATD